MKRFWLILLSLGLITAFSTQASAVDVKFSGDFYVAGMYLDKTDLREDTTAHTGDGPSTAFFYQRLRLRTDFVVSPGLSFITRADIMERVWGGKRAAVATPAAADTGSAQTAYENENIAFDWAYISYASPIGTFDVGYMNDGVWGTVFMDSSSPAGVIAWSQVTGPWKFILKIVKLSDNSLTAINNTATNTDLDSDKYAAAVKYSWKDGEAGLLATYVRDATKRKLTDIDGHIVGYERMVYGLQPYAKAQIGPVKIQAELDYMWGSYMDMESGIDDVKIQNLGFFLDAVADFNMFYAGGTLAYISGDDPDTSYKSEGGNVSGGRDWDPCLIMFNQDRTYWEGTLPGYASSVANSSPMNNAWFYQGRAGVRPMPKLDIMASVSYAAADQRPTGVINREYGWEADLTGTYKITNNLSYMLGAGYLWTGDYYKGSDNSNKVNDNYMLINKLTLTF